jgi:hypothetical protein
LGIGTARGFGGGEEGCNIFLHLLCAELCQPVEFNTLEIGTNEPDMLLAPDPSRISSAQRLAPRFVNVRMRGERFEEASLDRVELPGSACAQDRH